VAGPSGTSTTKRPGVSDGKRRQVSADGPGQVVEKNSLGALSKHAANKYNRTAVHRTLFLQGLSKAHHFTELVGFIAKMPSIYEKTAQKAVIPEWATWEYSDNHLPEEIHTSAEHYDDLQEWLESQPYYIEPNVPVQRRAAERIALAVGMIMRDIERSKFAEPDEHDPSVPGFVLSSIIPEDDYEDVMLPFCEAFLKSLKSRGKDVSVLKEIGSPSVHSRSPPKNSANHLLPTEKSKKVVLPLPTSNLRPESPSKKKLKQSVFSIPLKGLTGRSALPLPPSSPLPTFTPSPPSTPINAVNEISTVKTRSQRKQKAVQDLQGNGTTSGPTRRSRRVLEDVDKSPKKKEKMKQKMNSRRR
jgi:hypothetical protein